MRLGKRNKWTCASDFPFRFVNFLSRKKRMHERDPFWYVIICDETKFALAAHSSVIYDGNTPITIGTNTVDMEESLVVYRLPVSKCIFIPERLI